MEQIEGRQPVREALRAGRAIKRILVAEGAQTRGTLSEILSLAREHGVRVEQVPRSAIDRRALTPVHQGVIAEVQPRRARSWKEGVAEARAAGRTPLLLALDGVEDPRNLGALVRSADAFGVDAVLVPSRRSAGIGPAAIKASAGALENVLVDEVGNLERTLAACKKEGIWIVAMDASGGTDISVCALLEEPVAIVVGAEGRGVSRLIRERADIIVSIPMPGTVASLNASVAGGIALWETSRRRRLLPGSKRSTDLS